MPGSGKLPSSLFRSSFILHPSCFLPMAPPIYFFEKATRAQLAPGNRLSAELLARHGLAATLADVADVRRECWLYEHTLAGPGGTSGAMLCALPVDQPPPVRLRYAPEFQEWTHAQDGLWIAVDREHPPTPADLRRNRRLIPGYQVALGDGQPWVVPIIRNPDGGTSLPTAWRYDAAGQIQEEVTPAYRALWETGTEILALYASDQPASDVDRTWAVDRCLTALGLNYRLGRHEQNLLGLVDSDTWLPILGATIDYLTFREVIEAAAAAKKNGRPAPSPAPPPAETSTSTSPGPEAETPTTAPPAAN